MLAPIRITVDDRTEWYRIKSKKIIDAYRMGDLKDYRDNPESLRKINKLWEQASTIGYSMTNLTTVNNEQKEKIVWDYDIYPDGDYFTRYANSNSKSYPSQDVLNFMSVLIASGKLNEDDDVLDEGENRVYDMGKFKKILIM